MEEVTVTITLWSVTVMSSRMRCHSSGPIASLTPVGLCLITQPDLNTWLPPGLLGPETAAAALPEHEIWNRSCVAVRYEREEGVRV